MSGMFRCAGDILFDDHQPLPGQISNVQLKKFSETSNFLQLQEPLTREHPYFFAQIRASAEKSQITIGVAGPDLDNDAHPGHWNNTVGYHSNTGKCFTSHSDEANTNGEKFSVGDMFGLIVTHFGKEMSTVVFLKNGLPVATRYLFEKNHRKFLPTICLEYGPIDLGIMWPQAAMGTPQFDERNMLNWIKSSGVKYDRGNRMFVYDRNEPVATLQSPNPLNKDIVHYEVQVKETSEEGEGPGVGVATCSPLKPSPTCILLRDFFRWKADGKAISVQVGQRIGFGIHYNPDERYHPGFSDKEMQLVLCFVTLDSEIVLFQMMMQPVGGFYPLVLLCRNASKVEIDVETNRQIGEDEHILDLLDRVYREQYEEALVAVQKDTLDNELHLAMFRKSDAVSVAMDIQNCTVSLSHKKKGIHVIQLQKPLTPDNCYCVVEINKLNEDSVLSLGVADSQFPLNKHPGRLKPSTGWVSRDGKIYFNGKLSSTIEGEMLSEGDTVGVQVKSFEENLSVVLFIKNNRPIATRYVSMTNLRELLPTISLCGNGYDVEINVFWQNRISLPPSFKVTNLNHWCRPEEAVVDCDLNVLSVGEHLKPVVFQCPHCLDEDFNHFEIQLTDPFGEKIGLPPPVIALSAASSQENISNISNFKLDYLRFWPVGEAEASVKIGDLVGWGLYIPESQRNRTERLVICYLTINRNIVLTRVMYEPPGGLFPIVYLPADVNRVKLEFSAIVITSHPITEDVVNKLLRDAEEIIVKEQHCLSQGKDIDELNIDKSQLLRPIPKTGGGEAGEENQSELSTVVLQATGVDKVHKMVKVKREQEKGGRKASGGRGQGQNSKACVLL